MNQAYRQERAEIARKALNAYLEATEDSAAPPRDAVPWLITDLLHLLAQGGDSVTAALRTAQAEFAREWADS